MSDWYLQSGTKVPDADGANDARSALERICPAPHTFGWRVRYPSAVAGKRQRARPPFVRWCTRCAPCLWRWCLPAQREPYAPIRARAGGRVCSGAAGRQGYAAAKKIRGYASLSRPDVFSQRAALAPAEASSAAIAYKEKRPLKGSFFSDNPHRASTSTAQLFAAFNLSVSSGTALKASAASP